MTTREERTRALLEAVARDREVDTARLWSRLEPELESVDRRPQRASRPGLLVAAAAAATVAVVGATVWASGWGDRTTPLPVASSTSVVTTSPSTQTSTTAPPTSSAPTGTTSATSTPPPPATTTAPPARAALSTKSLLVAADYEAAGWVVDSVQASEGWGQSPISACQDLPGAGGPGGGVFRGDGYATVAGQPLATYQYALQLASQAAAAQLVDTVRAWPEGCPSRTGDVVTSSTVHSVKLPHGQQGHWYTLSLVQPSGLRHDELIAVTRAGDRVVLVVLHEYNAPTHIDPVDATELLTRAVDRLG